MARIEAEEERQRQRHASIAKLSEEERRRHRHAFAQQHAARLASDREARDIAKARIEKARIGREERYRINRELEEEERRQTIRQRQNDANREAEVLEEEFQGGGSQQGLALQQDAPLEFMMAKYPQLGEENALAMWWGADATEQRNLMRCGIFWHANREAEKERQRQRPGGGSQQGLALQDAHLEFMMAKYPQLGVENALAMWHGADATEQRNIMRPPAFVEDNECPICCKETVDGNWVRSGCCNSWTCTDCRAKWARENARCMFCNRPWKRQRDPDSEEDVWGHVESDID